MSEKKCLDCFGAKRRLAMTERASLRSALCAPRTPAHATLAGEGRVGRVRGPLRESELVKVLASVVETERRNALRSCR
jgi:hypothetical protein